MKLQIPYDEVKKRFPQEVDLIMSKLRKSTSIRKQLPEEDLTWEFSWGQRVQGLSFQDLIDGKQEKKFHELYPAADQDNVREFLGDSISWGIMGRAGKWSYGTPEQRDDVPIEIIDLYVKMYTDQIIERKRIEGLTPEEKHAEREAVLKALRRSPGFVEVHLGK